MSETNQDLPVFPTSAPAVFQQPDQLMALFEPVFSQLSVMVEVPAGLLGGATPCEQFTVGELRRHVLAWLQFFAAALSDPAAESTRIDPETWELGADQQPGPIVQRAAADIRRAIDSGAAKELVVMSQSRMAGDGVLAMALGEYQVHGWDLAVSTQRSWTPDDAAAEPALAFLHTTVAPEYRGPDTGFFDAEVPAPADASSFERLLCFAGRRLDWSVQRG